ncbi:hypothetical protein INR49_005546, partial [Caranx melampygus]
TVKQMWPFICQFVDKLFRETIEPAVKSANPHLSSFCFTKIDMGDKNKSIKVNLVEKCSPSVFSGLNHTLSPDSVHVTSEQRATERFKSRVLPLRVNGVKVYTENVDKRQVIMDLQISFVGNTEIDVDIKKYYCRAGIKSIQVRTGGVGVRILS